MTEPEYIDHIRYLLDRVINYGYMYDSLPNLRRERTEIIQISRMDDDEILRLLKIYRNATKDDDSHEMHHLS